MIKTASAMGIARQNCVKPRASGRGFAMIQSHSTLDQHSEPNSQELTIHACSGALCSRLCGVGNIEHGD